MSKLIAYCGIDCSKCDAYIATITNDSELKAKTAKENTVRAFIPNQFWGRTFAINALWVMDNLAIILNFEYQHLYFYFKDKYKRYKEFRN